MSNSHVTNNGFSFQEFGGVGLSPDTRINGMRADGGNVPTWYGSSAYDATKHRPRQRGPFARMLSEDQELRQNPRRQLSAATRDLVRNFSIVAAAHRCHLDHTSTFHFRSNTGDRGLDKQIDGWMRWWALPQNCDAGGRHSLNDLIRLWESLRSLDGDCLINRQADGRIQTVEGDRIQTDNAPYAELGIEDPRQVVNGVWINPNGRAIGYLVFKRELGSIGIVFDKLVPAKFADLHAYYFRIDQVRGIAPLASAANGFKDVYKNFGYALRKSGLSQLAGMLFTRQGSEAIDQVIGASARPGDDQTAVASKAAGPRYQFDVDDGLFSLDLDPGDDVKFIESHTPSTEFKDFQKLMLMVSVKAYDLPYSFIDEAYTNFAGQQQAKIRYFDSCKGKQRQNRQLLDKATRWRLGLAVFNDEISLPAGMTPADLKWEWHHQAPGDYSDVQSTTAAIARINSGISSLIIEAKHQGRNIYEMIDQKADVEAYARGKGVILSTALPAPALADPNASASQTEDENEEQADDGKPATKKTASSSVSNIAAQQLRPAQNCFACSLDPTEASSDTAWLMYEGNLCCHACAASEGIIAEEN